MVVNQGHQRIFRDLKSHDGSPIIVSPSLLSADFSKLGEEIRAIERAGGDWIHLDVMDGHFVPNITMGPAVVSSLRNATDRVLDVHLMIENPEKYIASFAQAGADILTFHVEATAQPRKLCEMIRSYGVRPGITLRPKTPVEEIFPFIEDVDLVLVMTVNPGFSGQGFLPDQVAKIESVFTKIHELQRDILIEVDGGINEETGRQCVAAGARVLVAGNYIFKNDYVLSVSNLKGLKCAIRPSKV